jgi:DNA phosphorothioation-dependent restriction protein DptG
VSVVKPLDLAGANQTSQSSDSYSTEDVNSVAKKLEEWGNSLPEQQRELLQHLVAGAESLFTRATKEELVVVADKQIKDAAISALRTFIDSKRGKKECYFWVRSGTVGPR